MKTAALFVALFSIVVGIVGLVSPDYGVIVRRQYFASPLMLYPAVALRLIMGVVVILAARASRAPTIMRLLGGVMCLQALTATVLGPAHARAVMEWETAQGSVALRAGAAVALVAGGFMVFAVTARRRPRKAETGNSH